MIITLTAHRSQWIKNGEKIGESCFFPKYGYLTCDPVSAPKTIFYPTLQCTFYKQAKYSYINITTLPGTMHCMSSLESYPHTVSHLFFIYSTAEKHTCLLALIDKDYRQTVLVERYLMAVLFMRKSLSCALEPKEGKIRRDKYER